MKPAYLGGVRGYQSAVYKPGTGWSGAESRRHSGHQPAVFRKSQPVRVSPMTVAFGRRPGLKTRTAIVATVVAVAGILALVLAGGAQL
jgi:hypothetical protein